jgi:superfamily II DNA helicase RecQ
MQMRFFSVPALDPASAEAELNRLLAAGRVAGLERQFVAAGAASFWAVCVSLADGPGPLPAALKAGAGRKLDYREVLSEADFAVFARLRDLRKTLAEAEGVPPYAVFTNEQLAALVTGRVHSVEAMARIEGIGPARVERYASAFLPVLREATIAAKAEP